MLLSACDSKNNKGSQENHLSDKKLSMPAKKEMRGRVGMKATDRMLTFIQADSDSISIEIDNGRIFGELEQGMPVDVAFIDIDGHHVASTIVSLPSIAHQWTCRDDSTGQTHTIDLSAYDTEAKMVEDTEENTWMLHDGMIIINSDTQTNGKNSHDTLAILQLTGDTLIVRENGAKRLYTK